MRGFWATLIGMVGTLSLNFLIKSSLCAKSVRAESREGSNALIVGCQFCVLFFSRRIGLENLSDRTRNAFCLVYPVNPCVIPVGTTAMLSERHGGNFLF